jgi:hypothetical protein
MKHPKIEHEKYSFADIDFGKKTYFFNQKLFFNVKQTQDADLGANHYFTQHDKWIFSIYKSQEIVIVSNKLVKQFAIDFLNITSDEVLPMIENGILIPLKCQNFEVLFEDQIRGVFPG